MLGIHDYWLFVVTGVLLNLTPGQDTFYILGRSLGQGIRVGIASALGIGAGCVVHTLAAAFGLSAILAASAAAFIAIKLIGAAYLVYLGIRMLTARTAGGALSSLPSPVAITAAFRQGLLTNVLNPKVALFFLAFMPQFIETDSQTKTTAFVVLGVTFVVTGTVWGLLLAIGAARLRHIVVGRPQILTLLSRAAGALFVFLGLRLAVER